MFSPAVHFTAVTTLEILSLRYELANMTLNFQRKWEVRLKLNTMGLSSTGVYVAGLGVFILHYAVFGW